MTKTLSFQLEVEDGWPPAAVECLPCEEVPGGFRIRAAPLFVKGLSVGDVIRASPDEESRVWEWEHLSLSAHTTVWILRCGPVRADIERLLARLRAVNCNTVSCDEFGCHAVDVPPECPIASVDEILDGVDTDDIAIAFPSFRHQDGADDDDRDQGHGI